MRRARTVAEVREWMKLQGPLPMSMLASAEAIPDPCPLCRRPNYHPTDHHLVPKSRGGKVTKTLCRDCHRAIHVTFTNKELEKTYYTVDALMGHEEFAKMIRHISKQHGRVKMTPNKRRGKRP